MRIFSNMVDCVKEVERDLWEMGHKVRTKTVQDQVGIDPYESKEIVGYNFTLLDGSDWDKSFLALGYKDDGDCVNYVQAELDERVHLLPDTNPGMSWKHREEIWSKFLHEGKFSYTYSDRMNKHFNTNQWERIDDLHNYDPASRQLILQIYDQWSDKGRRGGIQRVPCTMYYQFLERNGVLTLIHNMRSCDLYTHFPIDLSLTWKMCEGMAMAWNKIPRVIMQIGSLHAFRESMEKRGVF